LLRVVQQWVEQQTNWLLILDNADDLRIFKTVYSTPENSQKRHSPELHQYVPKSQTGTVIWISRDKGILGNLVKVNRGVEVGAMTMEESRQLFQQLSGQDDEELSRQDEKLKELLEILEMLPLAIAQAAVYIRKTNVSIRQYLSFFAESESRQLNLLSQEFQDVYRSDVSNSLMRTWLISMRQLADESPCGENILNTIAFFDNQEIPFELVRLAAGPDFKADGVLMAAGRLIEYSFLQIKQGDEDLQGYEQHRLVNLAVRIGLSEMQTRELSGEALWIMLQLFPDGSHETWKACELYLPHALKAVSWEEAEYYVQRAPQLLERIAMFYSEQGRSSEAEEVELKVLQMHEKRHGEEHPKTITAMSNLAFTWHRQGRFEEAEEAQSRVLKWKENAFGKEDARTITAMANLAGTWRQQGRFKEAEEAELEVLELRKKSLGETHPHTIIAMKNLGQTWSEQGKVFAAEKLLSRVRDLRTELLGERHPETVGAMSDLATCWNQQGQLEKAESLQKTVLELQKELLGEKHPDTIMAMANLANTWNQQGRWEEAERLQIEVLELRKELFRDKHPSTIMAMANLATIWHQQGRLDQAEKQGREVLELRTLVLGERHPDTITTKANLAVTLWQQDRITEAEKYETEVLDLQKEVLGDKHPNTITAMESLATTRWKQGRLDEARQLQEDVVTLRKEVLGEEHPDTTVAVASLRLINPESSEDVGKVGSQAIHSIASDALASVQPSPASKEIHGRRKAWKRKLVKWKEVENI
jgi:tetratricopeptide (TPR) repeat protein